MLTHEKIVEAVKKAVDEFSLSRVEYFGSYADDWAAEDSDLDLLVEFTEPTISVLTIIGLKHFLEYELIKSVDIVHVPMLEGAIIEIGKTVSIL